MSVKALQQRANSLIKIGNKDEAADIIFEYWEDNNRELPKSLAVIIEKISDVSQTAAYILAFSLPEEQADEKERLLMFASTSYDDDIIAEANMDLAEIYVDRNDDELALKHLRVAASHDHPSAKHLLALALVVGKMGLERNIDEAVGLLTDLIDQEYTSANVTLANLMLAGLAKVPDFDPFQLIAEAAKAGDVEAMEMLVEFGSATNGLPPEEEPMLPYTVIPEGMKRPKLVRDALLHEFKMTKTDAEEMTAGLYGFSNWSLLTSAATDPKKPKGKYDEDLEPAELNERDRLLSSVFSFYIDCEEYIADIAISLLKPTARAGKPSLKRLEERINSCMVPIGSRTLSMNMNHIVDQYGGNADFENSIRKATPARADVWLDMMASFLGWKFDEVDPDADADGSWTGSTHAKDNRKFDIFISRVSFTPGDKGDEHVFEIQRRIQKMTQNAILLFNKPLIHLPDPKTDFGAFYGGLILDNGKWNDFVLRPEGGIDDAIAQKLTISEEMNEQEVASFSFKNAGSLVQAFANYLEDIDPESADGCVAFGTINGWTNFIPLEKAKMLSAMMRKA